MKIEKVSINGLISPADLANIDALDHALVFGLGVFETFRVSKGKIFLLQKHLDRLFISLDYLFIPKPKVPELTKQINNLVDQFSSDSDLFIRLMVTAGRAEFKLSDQKYNQPNVIIYAAKIDAYYSTPKSAKILSSINRQLPEYFAVTGRRLKTIDYLSASIAKAELAEFEKTQSLNCKLEGILLSPDGYVAEALTSNIFWVKEERLYTPPLSLGILPGVIRNSILRNNQVEEKLIRSKELEEADEIFLSNSVNYLSPLNQLNKTKFPGISGSTFVGLSKRIGLN